MVSHLREQLVFSEGKGREMERGAHRRTTERTGIERATESNGGETGNRTRCKKTDTYLSHHSSITKEGKKGCSLGG